MSLVPRYVLPLVLALALPVTAAAQTRPAPSRVRAVVDSLAHAYVEDRRSPGLSIEVMRGRDTIVRAGYGFADMEQRVAAAPSTLYEIGSITKQFTAAAVMRLVEAGRIRLDDSIAAHIADLPVAWRRVTVRQLLNHTSGIPSYTDIGERWLRRWRDDLTTDSLVGFTVHDSMWFTPGTNWRYDNTGYVLLGVLLDRVTGEPFPSFVESKLIRPLGLGDTHYCDLNRVLPGRAPGYDRDSSGWHRSAYLSMTQPYSAGALCSTVDDLARWNVLLAGGTVVSRSSYLLMTTPEKSAQSHKYGFGLVADTLGGRRMISHGGGIPGFTSANGFFPDDSLSVTVLTNTSSAGPDSLFRNVARAALGVPLVRPARLSP